MKAPIIENSENLLDIEFIKEQLSKVGQNEWIKLIAALKDQCVANHIAKSDFNQVVKEAKKELAKSENKKKLVVKKDCLPAAIQNIPENYQIDHEGIFTTINGFLVPVCPHLIFPIEILKDIETGEERVRIAFKRKGNWNTDIVLNKIDIATKKGVVKLAAFGILVNDDNALMLVKWFAEIEAANEESIKTTYCTNSLGYSKYGFIPYSSNIVYNCQNSDNKRRFELYKTKGDKDLWLFYQNKVFDYTIPKIVIAGAYASLLLEKFGINPFGIHLWGETGKGKSVSILTSASVYGYPDIKNGIVYTGNATNNGLESRLAFVKNCTFYLDELSMLSSKQIDDMIYLIMQGQGKARMGKDGNSRDTYYWNCVSVSNSEMPITNDTSKGGTFNRIIQLCCDGNIFGDLDLREISDVFKNNYGFGAKPFIELLENEDIQLEIAQLKKNYYNQVINNTEDKQANAASCILTAFEIARKYIYKTDKKLTVDEIKPFLYTQDQISQVMRSYHKLVEWITANMIMFDETDIGAKAKWGATRSDSFINIYPYIFESFCKTINIDVNQFLKGLKQHNLLQFDSRSCKKNVRLKDGIYRMIVVKLPIYDEDENDDKDNNSVIVDMNGNPISDKDLPF